MILPKNGFFKIYNFKTVAQITPPKKVGILRPKKFSWALKNTKNLTSVIGPNIEGGSYNGPAHLGTIRPLEKTHLIREDIKKKTADLVKMALLGGGGQKNY